MNNTIFVELSGNPGFIRLEIKLLQLLLTLGYVRHRFQNLDYILYYKKIIKLTIQNNTSLNSIFKLLPKRTGYKGLPTSYGTANFFYTNGNKNFPVV